MAKSSSKLLRVACIGCGGIAGAHLREYAKMSDVQIVALADPVQAALDRWAKEFNIPAENCYLDCDQMLREARPDAVSVCSPNGAHAPNTIAALNAGAHVIVEKPMAMNAAECEAMMAAAKKNKRKLVIGFQQRYLPATQFIRNAADEGQLGKIVYARVQALRRRGIPNWGVFVRKDLQGGGPMIDIGVHVLEMTHYTMGSPRPVAASGKCFTYIGDKPSDKIESVWKGWDWKHYTVEDLAVGQIRFEGGAVLSIEASFAAHIEKDVWNFSIMGRKGGAQYDPPMIFTDEAGHMVNKTPGWLPKGSNADSFWLKMRNFVDHCLYGKPTMCPAGHGLMVQKMLDGIYESSEKGGREVAIR